jgi:hypothetical protein
MGTASMNVATATPPICASQGDFHNGLLWLASGNSAKIVALVGIQAPWRPVL